MEKPFRNRCYLKLVFFFEDKCFSFFVGDGDDGGDDGDVIQESTRSQYWWWGTQHPLDRNEEIKFRGHHTLMFESYVLIGWFQRHLTFLNFEGVCQSCQNVEKTDNLLFCNSRNVI